jgi:hypothetical protein
MVKELMFTKKVGITDSDLFDWIEAFYSKQGIKANKSIVISHNITEKLVDYLFNEIDKKINKSN